MYCRLHIRLCANTVLFISVYRPSNAMDAILAINSQRRRLKNTEKFKRTVVEDNIIEANDCKLFSSYVQYQLSNDLLIQGMLINSDKIETVVLVNIQIIFPSACLISILETCPVLAD